MEAPDEGAVTVVGTAPVHEKDLLVNFGTEHECFFLDRHGQTPAEFRKQLAADIAAKFNIDVVPADANGKDYTKWQLKSDLTIGNPDAPKVGGEEARKKYPGFVDVEVVSPILKDTQIGLVCDVMRFLQTRGAQVDYTCGLHVHIGIENLTFDQLRSMCVNFVKYEEVFDYIMPPSRRTSTYCRSNRAAVIQKSDDIMDIFRKANDLDKLINWLSPHKYFKLNLFTNVKVESGKLKGTVEWRQHSATINPEKTLYWVAFVWLCTELFAKHPPAADFPSGTHPKQKFQSLFADIIGSSDLGLKAYYVQRWKALNGGEDPTK